jgi:hypothetical protein
VTLWESTEKEPDFRAFLQSRGWTAAEWNKTTPPERTAERVEYNGGLVDASFAAQLPGAISDTVSGYAEATARAVTGTAAAVSKVARGAVVLLGVIVSGWLLLVYGRPLLRKGGR